MSRNQPRPTELHPAEVRRRLDTFVEEHGSQYAAAARMGISKQMIGAVLNSGRPISPRMLKWLGLRREIRAHYYTVPTTEARS